MTSLVPRLHSGERSLGMRVGKWRLRGWPLGFGIELGNKVSWTGEWRLGMGAELGNEVTGPGSGSYRNEDIGLGSGGEWNLGMRLLDWGVEPGNEAIKRALT